MSNLIKRIQELELKNKALKVQVNSIKEDLLCEKAGYSIAQGQVEELVTMNNNLKKEVHKEKMLKEGALGSFKAVYELYSDLKISILRKTK